MHGNNGLVLLRKRVLYSAAGTRRLSPFAPTLRSIALVGAAALVALCAQLKSAEDTVRQVLHSHDEGCAT